MMKHFILTVIIFLNFKLFCQITVNASLGTLTGSYTSLKTAFDAINAGTHKGVIDILLGASSNQTITETAQPILNKSGSGLASYTSILITPAFSNITITASFAGACCVPSGVVNLNAANNVTIDGRISSAGTNPDLTFENSSTGTWASTIIFNGASNNIVRYCVIKSSTLGTSPGVATISFLYNGTTVSGCQNNTIEFCSITKSGTNLPNISIASNSTNSTNKNSSNILRNNNIFDFKKYGIWLGNSGATTYDDLWVIQENYFYETSTITINSTDYANYAIFVGYHSSGGVTFYNTTGQITILNNIIGGNGSGGDWTVTSTSGNSGLVVGGIYLGASSTGYSEINGNEIRKFNVTTYVNTNTTISGFNGIYTYNSKVKIGNNTGNKIYNIFLDHKSTWGGVISGITVRTNTNLSNEIKNNKIYCINAESGTAYFQYFYGIYDYANSSLFADVISNNIVTKINLKLNSNCWGIYGSGQIYQNHVSKIKVNNGTADLTGIQFFGVPFGTQLNNRVDNNEIILGFDSLGNSTAENSSIYGVNINAAGYAYYNSILIQGTHLGATKTFCLKLNTSSGTGYVSSNNLLYNARTGGTGKHYCILTTGNNPITSSNNAYVFEGSNSLAGQWNNATDCATLLNWATTSGELNSISETKTNKPIATLLPNANSSNANNLLPISDGWLCAGKVVTQNIDFINVLRNTIDPTTIGTYELNCLSILPIELLYFKAERESDVVDLNWSTASEIENSHFIIERSTNGYDWESLGRVESNGNSNEINVYKYFDLKPKLGLSYYRLKQVDYDGNYSYSNIESIDYEINNNFILHPNPAQNLISIKQSIILNNKYSVALYNSLGEVVLEHQSKDLETNNSIEIDVSNLQIGIYTAVVNSDKKFVTKLIINR